jgi:hypothetical protein
MEAMSWLEVTGGSHVMSKRRVTCLSSTAAFLFLLCACSAASAQLFSPEQVLRHVHAYEGSPRPVKEIATVFVRPFETTGISGAICKIDGTSYVRLGLGSTCPSVVYLLSGAHQLSLRYGSGSQGASPTVTIRVEAGKTYQLVGTRVAGEAGGRDRAVTSINTMPQGFALTYKDVYPSYYAGGTDRPNARINPQDADAK